MESARFGDEEPRAKKTGSSGCFVVLLIFLGLAVLATAVIGVAVYQAVQDPKIKEAVSAMGSMITAKGRQELEAAGCDAAAVIDMRPFANLAKQANGARTEDIEALEKAVFINCILREPKAGLTCEKLARIYRDAIKDSPNEPPEEVSVFIQTQGEQQPTCTGRYDPNGTYLGEAMPPPSHRRPPAEAPRFGTTPPVDR